MRRFSFAHQVLDAPDEGRVVLRLSLIQQVCGVLTGAKPQLVPG